MKKLTKQRKLLLSGAMVGIGAVLFTAATAQSAEVTIVPVLVNAGDVPHVNAAPASSAIFDDSSHIVASSLDGQTVAFSNGDWISIKNIKNNEVYLTHFAKNEQCTYSAGSTLQLSMSPDGKTLSFTTENRLYSCLAGLTGPEDATLSLRVWAARYVDGEWALEKVATDPGVTVGIAAQPVALNDGEVAFATSVPMTTDSPTGRNVYVKNLNTEEVVRISKKEQTGSTLAAKASNLEIVSSVDGRYLAWEATTAQTSVMLSDEAGNSVPNLVIADREGMGLGQRTADNVKMVLIPSVLPRVAQNSNIRSGQVKGFGPDGVGGNGTFLHVQNGTVHAYNIPENKLYDLKTTFTSVSKDGLLAFSWMSNSNSTTSAGTLLTLGPVPGLSPIKQTSLGILNPLTSSEEKPTAISVDRIFTGSTSTPYGGGGTSRRIVETRLP